MQQYIERILEGKFEYDKGNLEFGCSKIELTLKRGEICEGMFTVDGERTISHREKSIQAIPG